MCHGLDAKKARLAGLLHDLARLYTPQRLLDECAARGIRIGEFERATPIVLHAPLGAALAREEFGVTDPEILSAIAKHTHADEAMSPLDCVVFLADSLEPERHFPERAAFWQLAQLDLTAATRQTLASMLAYLKERGLPAAPQAAAALVALSSKRFGPKETLLDIVRDAALDKKGEDFVAIDVGDRTILADTFAFVTGRSRIHVRSIADAIAEAAKAAGNAPPRIEGHADGGWVLLDLGGIVAHVFTPEQRAFYNIERLWAERDDRRARSS